MSQKTILYSDIDGYQVVGGFAEATVDPMATWAAISDKLLALNELAQVKSCKTKIAAQLTAAQNYYNLYAAATKASDTPQATNYKTLYEVAEAQITTLQAELVTLQAAYETAKASLFVANEVYSTPGPGESAISDTDYTTLKAAFDVLGDHEQLLITGTKVVDYRDETYWLKTDSTWASTLISTIGSSLPDGAVLAEDLTDTQKTEIANQVEATRVAALSDADKLTEATAAQAAAKSAAAQTYNEGLIVGTDAATALADSQTAYKAALATINTKYGTSLS